MILSPKDPGAATRRPGSRETSGQTAPNITHEGTRVLGVLVGTHFHQRDRALNLVEGEPADLLLRSLAQVEDMQANFQVLSLSVAMKVYSSS